MMAHPHSAVGVGTGAAGRLPTTTVVRVSDFVIFSAVVEAGMGSLSRIRESPLDGTAQRVNALSVS
jgi:hypothetical protein